MGHGGNCVRAWAGGRRGANCSRAYVWLQLLQGGMALQSHVDTEIASLSIGVAIVTAVTTTGAPAALSWAWVGDADPVA